MPTEGITHEEEGFTVEPELFDEHAETLSQEEYEQKSPETFQEQVETDDGLELSEPVDPGKQIVLDHKGVGDSDKWGLYSKGESGRTFNGTEIFDAEGNSWTKEIESHGQPDDIALHHEMLAQWREGGGSVFFFPDHVERTDDGETLYVTFLKLGENGGVSYEIWAYETKYDKESVELAVAVAVAEGEELYGISDALSLAETGEESPKIPAHEFADTASFAEEVRDDIALEKGHEGVSEALIADSETSVEVASGAPIPEVPPVSDEKRGDSLSVLLEELFSIDLLRFPIPESEKAVDSLVSAEPVPADPVLVFETNAMADAAVTVHEPTANVSVQESSVAVSEETFETDGVALDAVRIAVVESPAHMPKVAESVREAPVDVTAVTVQEPIANVSVQENPVAVSGKTREADIMLDAERTVVAESSEPRSIPIEAPIAAAPERIFAGEEGGVAINHIRATERVADVSGTPVRREVAAPVRHANEAGTSANPIIEAPKSVAERGVEDLSLSANEAVFPDSPKTEQAIPPRGAEVLLRALGASVPATLRSPGDLRAVSSPEILRTSPQAFPRSAPISSASPHEEVGNILNGVRMRRAA